MTFDKDNTRITGTFAFVGDVCVRKGGWGGKVGGRVGGEGGQGVRGRRDVQDTGMSIRAQKRGYQMKDDGGEGSGEEAMIRILVVFTYQA